MIFDVSFFGGRTIECCANTHSCSAWKFYLDEHANSQPSNNRTVSVYIRRDQGLLHFTLDPCVDHPTIIPFEVIPLKKSVGFLPLLTFEFVVNFRFGYGLATNVMC